MFLLYIYGAVAFLMLMTVLTSCSSNNEKGKNKKKSGEKTLPKPSQPIPVPAVKMSEKTEKKKKEETPIETTTARENSNSHSDEIAETKTAILDAESAADFHTAHEEDSFDRLQPREAWCRRRQEIADAPKANRKDAEYDTLKMFVNNKADGFSQAMPIQN